MISNREWQDTYQKKPHLKVPSLTAIMVNEVDWQGSASSDKSCKGEDVHIDGRIVHRVVEYSTSLITITVESFLLSHDVVSTEYSAERIQCPPLSEVRRASHATPVINWLCPRGYGSTVGYLVRLYTVG